MPRLAALLCVLLSLAASAPAAADAPPPSQTLALDPEPPRWALALTMDPVASVFRRYGFLVEGALGRRLVLGGGPRVARHAGRHLVGMGLTARLFPLGHGVEGPFVGGAGRVERAREAPGLARATAVGEAGYAHVFRGLVLGGAVGLGRSRSWLAPQGRWTRVVTLQVALGWAFAG